MKMINSIEAQNLHDKIEYRSFIYVLWKSTSQCYQVVKKVPTYF